MPGTEATASRLATRRLGGSGPVVVILHGFAQTGACLGPLAEDLARDHVVLLPDAPGHGGSARHADADLPGAAELIGETVRQLVGGPVDLVGYSMGARMALQVAVSHPELVRSLTTIGGTAGLEDPAARAERRRRDEALAERVLTIGVGAFLDEWLAGPLFAGLPAWARFERERRTNTAAGLAASLRRCGTGAMEPLWDRLATVTAPALFVAGADDDRFAELAGRMAAAIGPGARAARIPGAGHAAHLERPSATLTVVRAHLGPPGAGGGTSAPGP